MARRVLTWAVYALIVGFFAWFAVTLDWSAIREVSVRWWFVGGAVAFGLVFRFYLVGVWRAVLVSLGARDLPPFRILASVYSRAWMGRYVPGKVVWIGGKVLFASEHGVPKSKLAVSSLVEAGAQVLGIGLASFALLAIDGRLGEVSPALQWTAIGGLMALTLGLLPPVFNWLVRLAFRMVGRGTPMEVSWRVQARAVGLFALGLVLTGASNAFLVFAVAAELGFGDLPFIVGAFGLASVLGMAVLVAPSGLGVRDGAQVALLSVVLTGPVVAVIVLLHRVLSAVMDVVFWAAADGWRTVRGAAGGRYGTH